MTAESSVLLSIMIISCTLFRVESYIIGPNAVCSADSDCPSRDATFCHKMPALDPPCRFGYCDCRTGYFFDNAKTFTCLPIAKSQGAVTFIGNCNVTESSNSQLMCDESAGLSCDYTTSKCQCQDSTMIFDKNTQACRPRTFGDPCSTVMDCNSGAYTNYIGDFGGPDCVSGKCDCTIGFSHVQRIDYDGRDVYVKDMCLKYYTYADVVNAPCSVSPEQESVSGPTVCSLSFMCSRCPGESASGTCRNIANVDTCSKSLGNLNGTTAVLEKLREVARRDDAANVRCLIKQYPNIDVESKDSKGNTVLHIAASRGSIATVKLLLDLTKSDVTKRNCRSNYTALHYAAENGNVQVGALLLDRGAFVDALDKTNRTPLTLATLQRRGDFVELLLARGADINAKDLKNRTALYLAAFWGYADMARLLLLHSADIDVAKDTGYTALLVAAYYNNIEIVRMLLENGANPNIKDSYGENALYFASFFGYVELAKLLVDSKVTDIEVVDSNGETALHTTAEQERTAVAKILIAYGANLEAKEKAGKTPLHIAASQNAATVAMLLLDAGADIEAKDNDGRTPLFLGTLSNSDTIVRMLLERGADVNAQAKNSKTALHIAAENNYSAIAELLIGYGARSDIVDKNSHTAVNVAKSAMIATTINNTSLDQC